MKRPRRPLHQPDPLVARAEAMPQRSRCRARTVHHKAESEGAYYLRLLRESRAAFTSPIPHDPPPVPAAYRRRIEAAMAEGGRVRLAYEDACGRRSTRIVRPRAWDATGDLFVADCELRGAGRHFRLDRLLDCQSVAKQA